MAPKRDAAAAEAWSSSANKRGKKKRRMAPKRDAVAAEGSSSAANKRGKAEAPLPTPTPRSQPPIPQQPQPETKSEGGAAAAAAVDKEKLWLKEKEKLWLKEKEKLWLKEVDESGDCGGFAEAMPWEEDIVELAQKRFNWKEGFTRARVRAIADGERSSLEQRWKDMLARDAIHNLLRTKLELDCLLTLFRSP